MTRPLPGCEEIVAERDQRLDLEKEKRWRQETARIPSQLAESWVNGNRNWVIEQLKNDHPGLTAALFAQYGPGGQGLLTPRDCNIIANRLINDRMQKVQS